MIIAVFIIILIGLISVEVYMWRWKSNLQKQWVESWESLIKSRKELHEAFDKAEKLMKQK